jgi:hypothetical protein
MRERLTGLVKDLFQFERDRVERRSEALIIVERKRRQQVVRRGRSIHRGQSALGHQPTSFPTTRAVIFLKRLSRATLCPIQGEAAVDP